MTDKKISELNKLFELQGWPAIGIFTNTQGKGESLKYICLITAYFNYAEGAPLLKRKFMAVHSNKAMALKHALNETEEVLEPYCRKKLPDELLEQFVPLAENKAECEFCTRAEKIQYHLAEIQILLSLIKAGIEQNPGPAQSEVTMIVEYLDKNKDKKFLTFPSFEEIESANYGLEFLYDEKPISKNYVRDLIHPDADDLCVIFTSYAAAFDLYQRLLKHEFSDKYSLAIMIFDLAKIKHWYALNDSLFTLFDDLEIWLRQFLLMCGDIESNPGPTNVVVLPQRQNRSFGPRTKARAAKQELNVIKKDVKQVKKVVNQEKRILGGNFRSNIKNNAKQSRTKPNNNSVYYNAVETIALPGYRPFRWGSQFNDQETAAGYTQVTPDVGFAKGATLTHRALPATEMYGIMTKNISCNTITWDANPDNSPWRYDFSFRGRASGVNTYDKNGILQAGTDVLVPVPIIQGDANSGFDYKPHGDHWYAARHEDSPADRWVWLNYGDKYSITLQNNSVNPVTFHFAYGVCNADTVPVFEGTQNTAAVASGATVIITRQHTTDDIGMYYALRIGCTETENIGIVGIAVTSDTLGGGVFRHEAMTSFDSNFSKIESYRLLGTSLMFTDTAAFNVMQGRVLGCQIPCARNWMDYINDFSAFSKLKGKRQFPAMKGIYGFTKPTCSADFDFVFHHTFDGTTMTDSFWPIKYKNDYIAIYASITTSGGQDAYWTRSTNFEYRSNDQFPELKFSTTSRASCDRALEVIKTMIQWHENPLHLSDIITKMRNGIRTVANNVAKYTPVAMKYAKEYGPYVLQGAATVASLL